MSATRYVLVTGASRGLGRETALHLAGRGFRVFAGVRSAADGQRLMAGGPAGLHPVRLDVTDSTSVETAAQEIAERVGDGGLAGLVNNAGIAAFGPLEQEDPEELEAIFRVNVFGAVAVTRALLPAVRRARGRIVNVSSGNGKLAMPFLGAYCGSKFALEALSDALRLELAPWGIQVAVVEPGAMATDIRVKGVEAWAARHAALPPDERGLYAASLAAVQAAIHSMEAGAGPAAEVADAVFRALTDSEPRARYPVGPSMDQLGPLLAMPDPERDRIVLGMLGLA